MGVPQLLLIGLYALSLGCHLAKHGERHATNYNFFVALLSTTLQMLLLWWGGFFG